jgi:6-phosphogluconolactonase
MRSFIVFLLFIISFTSEAQNYYLFIGTYTNTGSKGIYVYRFDASTGKLTWASNTDSLVNPSYLSLSPDGKFLYACTETRTANAGSVSAFAFDAKNGKLTFLNKQSSGGDNPVYVTVHKSRKWIALGNYSGGNLAVFPVNKDGSLQPYRQLIQHAGSSINKERQEKAHVHSTIFSPDHNFLFAPDLGMDKVMGYRFREKEAQPLTVAGDGYKALAGSGPRHLCFRPDGKFAYLAEEMAGAVVVFKYNAEIGKLDPIQTLVTHRDTAKGPFGSADIHPSPDGRFLYVSNRGKENNLAVYSIDRSTGSLTIAGYQFTGGTVPRNFIVEPSGKFLLVANQESGNVVVFRINKKTGLPEPTGVEIKIPQPVCLQLLKL